jgi:hypothetical protein
MEKRADKLVRSCFLAQLDRLDPQNLSASAGSSSRTSPIIAVASRSRKKLDFSVSALTTVEEHVERIGRPLASEDSHLRVGD